MRILSSLLLLALPALAGGADDAKALLAKGEAAKAVETARKATAASPADIDAWLVLADALLATGEPEAAWEAMDGAITKNPQDARLSIKRGDVFVRLAEQEKVGSNVGSTIVNYYLDAERNYKEALGKDPKSAEAVYGMASVNFELGDDERKEKAKKLISDCLGLDKDFFKAHALQADILYLDATVLARAGKHDDAKPKFQAAEHAYATAIKLGDKHQRDMVRYGHTLLAQERLDEAAKAYVEALKAWPMGQPGHEPDTPIRSGLYHVANYRAPKASWANPKLKTLLDGAAKEVPGSPHVWYYLGYCQAVESDWDAALKSYAKARDLAPKNARFVYEVGYIHEKLGDADKALAAYREALALFPDHPQATQGFYGIIMQRAGDRERAEKLFEELVELSPTTNYVLNDYALLLRNWAEGSGQHKNENPPAEVKRLIKRSAAVYEMAAAAAPEVAQIQSDTGLLFWFYPCNFDGEKAKSYLKQSLNLSDYAYLDAWNGLDQLCRMIGDWETLADYAERVVGSMERGNVPISPVGAGEPVERPNEKPGMKARAEAALKLAREKLKKS